MKTIRWGIIGCGDVTEKKSGPAFRKSRNSQLVAVMRRNLELAEDYARRHKVPKWYGSAEALINDPQVDAVYIATPPSSHKEYTLLSAQAGKPVYVEKPMALNYDECREMIEKCDASGVPLFVAYYRRALPRFLKIKELIDSGVIGTVHFMRTALYQPPYPQDRDPQNLPWRVKPEISGGGYFVDLASHTLDFLDFILGPLRSVKGFASNHARMYPAEDIVAGSFLFESGVHGTGIWCFNAFEHHDMTEITGSEGSISFSTFDSKPVRLKIKSHVEEFVIDHPEHIQQPLIQTIIGELNGEGKCPSTGETAARTTKIMEELIGDYYRNR
jgi:predicted dehydrogenase